MGDHVTQKGSLVEPSRLRFDFSHMKPIQSEEMDKIEDFVNSMVSKKTDVKTRLMTPDEAVENGALALFGEKYGEEVRVLSMGDDEGNTFQLNYVVELMLKIQEILVILGLLANLHCSRCEKNRGVKR